MAMTEHLPGRPSPVPVCEQERKVDPEPQKKPRKKWIIGVSWLAVVVALGAISYTVSDNHYTVGWLRGTSGNHAQKISTSVVKVGGASGAHYLPSWVEAGISKMTGELRSDHGAIKNLQTEIAKLQQSIGTLTAQNMQLKVQLSQATHLAATEKLQLQESQRQIAPVRGGLPPMIERPSPVGSVQNNSNQGIVALSNEPAAHGKSGHAKPDVPAKGWLTIAVHGGNAVLQTPAGQVAMVHVGSTVDGEKVTGIDTTKGAVILNHHQWVYPPK